LAVGDANGYAKAVEVLHKSLSTITYAAKKVKSRFGAKAFDLRHPTPALTEASPVLSRLARTLLDEGGASETGLDLVARPGCKKMPRRSRACC